MNERDQGVPEQEGFELDIDIPEQLSGEDLAEEQRKMAERIAAAAKNRATPDKPKRVTSKARQEETALELTDSDTNAAIVLGGEDAVRADAKRRTQAARDRIEAEVAESQATYARGRAEVEKHMAPTDTDLAVKRVMEQGAAKRKDAGVKPPSWEGAIESPEEARDVADHLRGARQESDMESEDEPD
jgi:hypothetical protein